ncbi:ABC transporter ATP-binding protein [Myroides odoratimimus subsp. xuanwuensis]
MGVNETVIDAAVISAMGLTKHYPGVTALDHLDVRVGSGVTGLVGANGAGKSTLIKILLGLIPASDGSAHVLGHDVATQGAEIRALVGYMPEHDCLPADVSASDLVVHMGQMSGLPYPAARERASDVLRHVGLAEERYRPIGGYSTGMKQRVKLAQALVHDPRLVLLDEPTNGLDPSSRDDMLALVRRIGTEFGIAVLVTSHLLGELERISDHVVVLDGGRLLRSSATTDFLHATGNLLVEVQGRPDADRLLGQALVEAGLRAWPADGRMIEVEVVDETTPDVVRDLTVDLGLGLVRMQERHHRIEDVFRNGGAGSVQPV